MCTLAAYVGCDAAHPLVVAANRDEVLARPARPPTLLRTDPPRAVGGRDGVAGGTWLGLSEAGVVVGVLNRRGARPPDSTCRSRGLLCLDLLTEPSAAAARVAADDTRYAPFNLLVADATAAFVATQALAGPRRVVPLEPGLHLLTNLDVDDPTCPRIAASYRRFADAGAAFAGDADLGGVVARLHAVLADHAIALDPRGPGALCIHGDGYGTRSASVVVLEAEPPGARYWHADGPPCRTPLEPVALPFAVAVTTPATSTRSAPAAADAGRSRARADGGRRS